MKSKNTDISIIQMQLSADHIHNYFMENMDLFKDTLFKRVDIQEYSDKLSRKAVHFCAYSENELAGFLACYFNHPVKEFAYITTVSVSINHQNKGIAKRLMNEAIQYAKTNEFRNLRLEVKRNNLPAINMYNSLGFTLYESRGDDLFLELKT